MAKTNTKSDIAEEIKNIEETEEIKNIEETEEIKIIEETEEKTSGSGTDEKIKALELENASLKALMMQVLEKVNGVTPIAATAGKKISETAAEDFLDMVPVFLFKDDGKYKDDYFCQVNGRRYQIQRGKTVYVPRPVKEVIDHGEKQDRFCAEMIESLVQSYEASNK